MLMLVGLSIIHQHHVLRISFTNSNNQALTIYLEFLSQFSLLNKMISYSSRKNPYPPHGRSLEIPRGRGVLTVKILEAKYEAKLEFPGGRGQCKTKYLPWGEYGYFLELYIYQHGPLGALVLPTSICRLPATSDSPVYT